MSVALQVVIGFALGAIWPTWLIVKDRREHRAHMRRIRERMRR